MSVIVDPFPHFTHSVFYRTEALVADKLRYKPHKLAGIEH